LGGGGYFGSVIQVCCYTCNVTEFWDVPNFNLEQGTFFFFWWGFSWFFSVVPCALKYAATTSSFQIHCIYHTYSSIRQELFSYYIIWKTEVTTHKVKQVLWVFSWRRVILHSNKQVTVTSPSTLCIISAGELTVHEAPPHTIFSILLSCRPLLIEILCSAPLSHILNLCFPLVARDQDLHTKHPELDGCVNFNVLRISDTGAGLDIVKTRKISCPCQDTNWHFLRCIAYSIVTIPTELSPTPLQTLVITFFDASFHILELNVGSMLWDMVCDVVRHEKTQLLYMPRYISWKLQIW
jgi:hypothetical protein